MWFGVLGPLLVSDGESMVAVPATRQRVLLAALLVNTGAVVPADSLAEMVWDGAPSACAATTLRSHVMRLRRVLGSAAGARVVTRYPGYMVEATEAEVDLLRFGALCRQGCTALRAGDSEQASQTLDEALALWRDEPLADVPSDLLRRHQVPVLEQLRLQALEWRADAGLQLGRHAELVPELQALAAGHPLREHFHAQLMLALMRCGRQAEALERYQHARGVLIEELGAEPGAELRELHRRILTADPVLAVPPPAPVVASGSGTVTPRELPAPVAHFAGRTEELAALTALLDRSGDKAPDAIVISAIGGTAGVGKTALAVHWAHQVAGRFPDGQLYVNLRGYDPGQPVTSADALAGFLRALGLPGRDIPADEAERSARYRSLLAGRRMLVVLDNADTVEQVRPLLPGSASCAVVVTSRDSLAGLVARDGAARLDLDLLPLQDAVRLLKALIGTRVDAEPEATEALAGLCCRLPLALRVAAELAASRPAVPLAELAGDLTDQQRRLDLLEAGDDRRTAVRAVFSWSYRHLDAAAADTFRMLGLHPGADVEPYAAAALTASSLEQARCVLDRLARAHLIQPAGTSRYGVHDLLRAYARHLIVAQDGEAQRRMALTRLFDLYLYAAATAMDTLIPAERHRRPRVCPSSTPAPSFTSAGEAATWLDAERAVLVAVTVHAAEHGWPGHAIRLAETLFRYLDRGSHHQEAITIHTHARIAARLTGDITAEATALNALGLVGLHQSRYQQATGNIEQALNLYRQAGDRACQARALNNLGIASMQQGHHQRAASIYEQTLGLYREVGDQSGEIIALGNLGVVESRRGFFARSTSLLQLALALARETDDRPNQGFVLNNLGDTELRQGHSQAATGHFQQSLALARESGNRNGEATALGSLGDAALMQGDYPLAAGYYRMALPIWREVGDRSGEAEVLIGLGELSAAVGMPDDARRQHAAALRAATQIGAKYLQARALRGLGQACHATGDPGQGRYHWRQALDLYTELGAPEADQVRAQLAAAAPGR